MRRIAKKIYPEGSISYVIQYKILWWWETEQTFGDSWHGDGGYQDLEFNSFEDHFKLHNTSKV